MAFFWRPPLPLLSENEEHEHSGKEAAPTPPLSCGAGFWRLPLPLLAHDSDSDEDDRRADAASGALVAVPTGAAFWRLPLPALPPSDDELEADDNAAADVEDLGATDGRSSVVGAAPDLQSSESATASEPQVDHGPAAQTESSPVQVKTRSLADEMEGLVDRYVAERTALESNLRELADLQERLRRTIAAASNPQPAGAAAEASGHGAEAAIPLRFMPSEVVSAVLWYLDVPGVGQGASVAREWRREARSGERWRSLCNTDWGIVDGGTCEDYRRWLERWRVLQRTLDDLKHCRAPSGAFGSQARRRIFESLHTLADLGAARNASARYPARVPEVIQAARGGASLLMLLDDESPYLLYLSVRCLADVAAADAERQWLREAVVARGALVRSLLEGEDTELVEASARMLLNLHGGSPGVPILARRRGPLDFLCEDDGVPCVEPANAAGAALVSPFAPWSGAWEGEMRYARGGERHSVLRLVLGPEGDLAVEQARAAFRAIEQEEQGNRGARSESPAEFWHYFGFLAASDFDCVAESVQYVNEQLERRRLAGNSPSHRGAASGSSVKLVGAGWDDQNGSFTLEAVLPQMPSLSSPSSGGKAVTSASQSIAVHLLLQYDGRGSKYELTGFLAGGSSDVAAVGDTSSTTATGIGCSKAQASACRVLYGVWATAPSQHKHLFALQRVSSLQY